MTEIQLCPVCNEKLRLGRKAPYCSKKCEISDLGYSLSTQEKLAKLAARVAATTAWAPLPLDSELHIVTSKLLVLSDIHAPIQDANWLTMAIATGIKFGCRDVLINGDFIDAPTISRHLGSYYRRKQELEDDLNAADSILKILCEHFDRVFINSGNHDQRLVKQFGGEVSFKRIMAMLGTHNKVKITERSYCRVNNDILVVHPRQYKSSRGQLAQALSLRRQVSILTAHQHHSAMSISPCGKFQACDMGCLADLKHQDYVRNEITTFVEPVYGFSVIFGNKIQCFDKFTPWELWNLSEEAKKYLLEE